MAFSFDFSQDKPDIRAPIPAGTKLLLRFNYAPGGQDIPGTPNEQRTGALTKGKEGDTLYLKGEFTVLRGPYKGRKFWSNLTVHGGKLDEKGQSKGGKITRETIRSMIDSANGLATSDESPEAQAKRVLRSFVDLQNLTFIAKAKIEPEQNGYPAKNGLGQVLTIDHKDFPKSEDELDNPPIPQAAEKPAVPGFNFGSGGAASPGNPFAQTTQASGATSSSATESGTTQTQAAAEQARATPTQSPAEQPASNNDNGLPSWMKAA
jgi:hypothetical protein